MNDEVPAVLRALVQGRARFRCEYCLLHEEDAWEPHQPDHIIARKHRGLTDSENLAWTCAVCNRHKGSDVASIDSRTRRVVRLFHPRRDRWTRHFHLEQGRILPRTSVGPSYGVPSPVESSRSRSCSASLIRQTLVPALTLEQLIKCSPHPSQLGRDTRQ
jgi:5-methylcytosine-specific restriction endonuclease McrA